MVEHLFTDNPTDELQLLWLLLRRRKKMRRRQYRVHPLWKNRLVQGKIIIFIYNFKRN